MPHVAKAELYGKLFKTCGMPHVLKEKRIAKWGHAACRVLRRKNFMANGSQHAARRMPHVAKADLYGKWFKTCGTPHALKAKRIAK
jgi:hypothetical protein